MEKFARKCDCCGKGMNKGYLDAGQYWCSDKCLLWGNYNKEAPYTMASWEIDCKDLPDECYYTEWEEIDSDEYFDKEGNTYQECHKCAKSTKSQDFCEHCLTSL